MAAGRVHTETSIRAFLPWLTVFVMFCGWLVSYTQMREQVEDNRMSDTRQDRMIEQLAGLKFDVISQQEQLLAIKHEIQDLKGEVRSHIREGN